MRSKFIPLIIAILLIISLLPIVASAAPNSAAMRLDAENSFGIVGGGTNWVYFGDYDATDDGVDNPTPVKWQVLATDGNGGTYSDGTNAVTDPLFLLSEYAFSFVQFDDESRYSNVYEESALQRWCSEFLSNRFSGLEQAAVLSTSKAEVEGHVSAGLTGDRIFAISMQEYDAFLTTDDSRSAYVIGTSDFAYWWMRSTPTYVYDNTIASCYWPAYGYYPGFNVALWLSSRPAFNLNKDSVLFASAAEGSKPSGALARVESSSPSEWKLTLKDSSRSFAVSTAAVYAETTGGSVIVDYTGATPYNATTAPREYISAMIVDDSGNILYYSRLAQPDTARGALSIAIPQGLAVGSYTLKVFSEQYNGDFRTDYASDFADVTLTIEQSKTISDITKTSTNGSIDTYTITFSDGSTTTFTVTNGVDGLNGADGLNGLNGLNGVNGLNGLDGNGIVNIQKTRTDGNVDTYTITYTNGKTAIFTVTNGVKGKDGVNGTNSSNGMNSVDGKDGARGKDGNSIVDIQMTATDGNVDTYTISLADGTSFSFSVTNGKDGVGIVSAAVNEYGELILLLTDGKEINVGVVMSEGLTAAFSAQAQGSPDRITIPDIVIGGLALTANAGWIYLLLRKRRKSPSIATYDV